MRGNWLLRNLFYNCAFRIIVALLAFIDLELHHVDIKVAFLNGESEQIYTVQLEGFKVPGCEHKVCKLK